MNLTIQPATTQGDDRRRLLLTCALISALALGFYLYTLQPSLSWGDGTRLQIETLTGESFIQSELPDEWFQDDPFPFARLGVAAWDHPLYVILGHTLVRTLPSVHSPWLINAISAVFGAAAIFILFLLSYAYTRSYFAAILASSAVAVSHTFWFHAVTPEVYTLYAFLLLSSLYLFDRFERSGRFQTLALSLFLLGLGAANHILTFLVIPAYATYRALTHRSDPGANLPLRKLMGLGLAFLAGFTPYLIQLIRTLRIFPASEAFGPVIGSVFLGELLSTTPHMVLDSFLKYLLILAYQFGPLGLLIGVYGLWSGGQVSSRHWRKVLAFYLIYTTFGIFYRVTDQFVFFLTSHLFFGLAIALGAAGLVRKYPRRLRFGLGAGICLATLAMPVLYDQVPQWARNYGIQDETLGIPQIGTGTRDGLAYYVNPNKRAEMEAYRFGKKIFANAPPDALIIAEWFTDTDEFFVLRYFSTVEAQRPDVEIVGWPLEDPFRFPADLAVRLVEDQVHQRPVYLASLSDEFYDASALMERFCIVPELDLFRVYPTGHACLKDSEGIRSGRMAPQSNP